MIQANPRLVVKITRDCLGRGMALDDLIGEGNLRLIHAPEEYDPRFSTRFSTYASYWIKSAIRHALIDTTATMSNLSFCPEMPKDRIASTVPMRVLPAGAIIRFDFATWFAERHLRLILAPPSFSGALFWISGVLSDRESGPCRFSGKKATVALSGPFPCPTGIPERPRFV
jgi:RNA polymerase sigma factor (sigma-70 family)